VALGTKQLALLLGHIAQPLETAIDEQRRARRSLCCRSLGPRERLLSETSLVLLDIVLGEQRRTALTTPIGAQLLLTLHSTLKPKPIDASPKERERERESTHAATREGARAVERGSKRVVVLARAKAERGAANSSQGRKEGPQNTRRLTVCSFPSINNCLLNPLDQQASSPSSRSTSICSIPSINNYLLNPFNQQLSSQSLQSTTIFSIPSINNYLLNPFNQQASAPSPRSTTIFSIPSINKHLLHPLDQQLSSQSPRSTSICSIPSINNYLLHPFDQQLSSQSPRSTTIFSIPSINKHLLSLLGHHTRPCSEWMAAPCPLRPHHPTKERHAASTSP